MNTTPRSREGLAITQALISAAGFGFLGVFGRLGQLNGLANSTALSWRFIIAGIILAALLKLFWAQENSALLRKWPLLLGLFAYSLQSLLYFETVELIGPGKAALLLYTYPAIVTVLSWLLYRTNLERSHIIVLVLTTAGCIMVLYSPQGSFLLRGTLLGLLTATVYSFYLLLSEKVLKDTDPKISSFNICVGTAVSMSIVAVFGPSRAVPESSAQWAIVVGLAVICTVIPTVMLFAAIRRIGSAKAAVCSTLEPVIAATLGISLFGETYHAQQLIGGALIISSIVIIYRFRNQNRPQTVTAN